LSGIRGSYPTKGCSSVAEPDTSNLFNDTPQARISTATTRVYHGANVKKVSNTNIHNFREPTNASLEGDNASNANPSSVPQGLSFRARLAKGTDTELTDSQQDGVLRYGVAQGEVKRSCSLGRS